MFAARLRTWSTVDNNDDIEIPDTPAITKTVVGVPLPSSETLPTSFESLCAYQPRYLCLSELREHIHTSVYKKFVHLGTGHFVSEQEYNPKPDYIGSGFLGHEYSVGIENFFGYPHIDREDDTSHVVLGRKGALLVGTGPFECPNSGSSFKEIKQRIQNGLFVLQLRFTGRLW